MKKRFLLLTLCSGVMSLSVHAADKTPQQARMGLCNQQAAGMTGDTRKHFMSQCLSNKPMSQQDRMKLCNGLAGERKGDERKAYMSSCLKN